MNHSCKTAKRPYIVTSPLLYLKPALLGLEGAGKVSEEEILNTKILYICRLSSSEKQKKYLLEAEKEKTFAEVHFIFDFLD